MSFARPVSPLYSLPATIAIFLFAAEAAAQNGLRLEELGQSFKSEKGLVSWHIHTNSIPERLNVYRVSSPQWRQTFISNVIALADFKNPTEAHRALAPALRGHNTRYTDDSPRGERKSIILNPATGRLFYYCEGAIALPKETVENVPSEDEALRLALGVLTQLGFRTNELRRRPGTENIHYTRDVTTRSTSRNRVKKVIAQGLYLVRAIDGFGIDGLGTCGGISIRFGNKGKIAELELVWPQFHSPRSLPAADINELSVRIRQGKATIATDQDIHDLKSLTVTNATIWYFGSKVKQTTIHPFLSLDAEATIGERRVPVRINCPVNHHG